MGNRVTFLGVRVKDGNAAVRLALTDRTGKANEMTSVLGEETSGSSEGRGPRCSPIPFIGDQEALDPSSMKLGVKIRSRHAAKSSRRGGHMMNRHPSSANVVTERAFRTPKLMWQAGAAIFRHPDSNMQAI